MSIVVRPSVAVLQLLLALELVQLAPAVHIVWMDMQRLAHAHFPDSELPLHNLGKNCGEETNEFWNVRVLMKIDCHSLQFDHNVM